MYFCWAALGAEAVQYIDATLLTSLIPILLLGISLYFLLAPTTKTHSGPAPLSETAFAFTGGFWYRFYDGFLVPVRARSYRLFVALGHFSLVEATARTKVLEFYSNIAALTFFLIAGLPIWEIGLTMAVGGFIGARMGAKVVISKGQRWIRPLVITMSMLMALKLLWEQHHAALLSMFWTLELRYRLARRQMNWAD